MAHFQGRFIRCQPVIARRKRSTGFPNRTAISLSLRHGNSPGLTVCRFSGAMPYEVPRRETLAAVMCIAGRPPRTAPPADDIYTELKLRTCCRNNTAHLR
jgi:hypothetical protein